MTKTPVRVTPAAAGAPKIKGTPLRPRSGERRRKGAGIVFAAGGNRSRADFAATEVSRATSPAVRGDGCVPNAEKAAAGELGNPTAPRAAGERTSNGAVRGLAIRRDRAERSL